MTVFVDLDRHRVIDVVDGRHAAAVTNWLDTQDAAWCAQVATVASTHTPATAPRLDALPRWVRYYNSRRRHTALDGHTPYETVNNLCRKNT